VKRHQWSLISIFSSVLFALSAQAQVGGFYVDVTPKDSTGKAAGPSVEFVVVQLDPYSSLSDDELYRSALKEGLDAFKQSPYGAVKPAENEKIRYLGLHAESELPSMRRALQSHQIPFKDGANLVTLTPEQRAAFRKIWKSKNTRSPSAGDNTDYKSMPTQSEAESLAAIQAKMKSLSAESMSNLIDQRADYFSQHMGRLKRRGAYFFSRFGMNAVGGFTARAGITPVLALFTAGAAVDSGHMIPLAVMSMFTATLSGAISYYGDPFFQRIEHSMVRTELKNIYRKMTNRFRSQALPTIPFALGADGKPLKSADLFQKLKWGGVELAMNALIWSTELVSVLYVFTGELVLNGNLEYVLPAQFSMINFFFSVFGVTFLTVLTQWESEGFGNDTFRNRSSYYQVAALSYEKEIERLLLNGGSQGEIDALVRIRNFAIKKSVRLFDWFNGIIMAGSFAWVLSASIDDPLYRWGPLVALGVSALVGREVYRPEDVIKELPPPPSQASGLIRWVSEKTKWICRNSMGKARQDRLGES
jgi:hypothetical protein